MRRTGLASRMADEAESRRGNRNLLFELAALGLFLPGLLLLIGCVLSLATTYLMKASSRDAQNVPDLGPFGLLAAVLCSFVPATMFLLSGVVLRYFLVEAGDREEIEKR